jgi:hypothetical protein
MQIRVVSHQKRETYKHVDMSFLPPEEGEAYTHANMSCLPPEEERGI